MAHSISAMHSGVQFSDDKADEISAMLLLVACTDPSAQLSKVRIDLSNMNAKFHQLMEQEDGSMQVMIETSSEDYCKTQIIKVDLYCFCLTPWIEGSTSAAVYGAKVQKEFNVHNCCR